MKQEIQTLPVIFRAERSGEFKGQVTAVFPTCTADYAGQQFTVYAHIGQHSGGTLPWYRDRTRAARPDEFAALALELQDIYETAPAANPEIYGQPVKLQVCKRFTPAMRREWQADARAARDRLRADNGAGGPWTPAAQAATAAAIAADMRESVL